MTRSPDRRLRLVRDDEPAPRRPNPARILRTADAVDSLRIRLRAAEGQFAAEVRAFAEAEGCRAFPRVETVVARLREEGRE